MDRNGDIYLQHISVQKQQSVQRLVLGGSRDFIIFSQMREKSLDLGSPHFSGMAFIMKQDISFCPMYIRFFGAIGIMFQTDRIADLIVQLSGFWGW